MNTVNKRSKRCISPKVKSYDGESLHGPQERLLGEPLAGLVDLIRVEIPNLRHPLLLGAFPARLRVGRFGTRGGGVFAWKLIQFEERRIALGHLTD